MARAFFPTSREWSEENEAFLAGTGRDRHFEKPPVKRWKRANYWGPPPAQSFLPLAHLGRFGREVEHSNGFRVA
jgi:hypothetical protein